MGSAAPPSYRRIHPTDALTTARPPTPGLRLLFPRPPRLLLRGCQRQTLRRRGHRLPASTPPPPPPRSPDHLPTITLRQQRSSAVTPSSAESSCFRGRRGLSSAVGSSRRIGRPGGCTTAPPVNSASTLHPPRGATLARRSHNCGAPQLRIPAERNRGKHFRGCHSSKPASPHIARASSDLCCLLPALSLDHESPGTVVAALGGRGGLQET